MYRPEPQKGGYTLTLLQGCIELDLIAPWFKVERFRFTLNVCRPEIILDIYQLRNLEEYVH